VEALKYFKNPKNCFYTNSTISFPKLTKEELKSLDKKAFFFRDGLSIFGTQGIFVQRTKPGIPAAGVNVLYLDSSESKEEDNILDVEIEYDFLYNIYLFYEITSTKKIYF
jgi:hypothetical protein